MIAIAISPLSQRNNAFNWYVDSVSGDDGNDGRSPGGAFETIAALLGESLANGERIGLARGSHWDEMLDLSSLTNMTVQAYGSGNRPLLDASDAIASGSWAKTAGRTNVYEAALTLDDPATNTEITVYEDDVRLALVADVATCDSTPGSFYPTAHDTPFTLYIHTTGSDDPGSNGSTYEYANRRHGLKLDDYSIASGIHTRRGNCQDGSLAAYGRSCTLNDCLIADGTKHNALAEDGARVSNCTFSEGYSDLTTASMLVFNEAIPAGLGVTVTSCTFTCAAFSATAAINSHNNTSGSFGDVVISSCTFENVQNCSACDDVDSVTMSDCTASGVTYFVRPYAPYTISDCTVSSTYGSTRIIDGTGGTDPGPHTITDCSFTVSTAPSAGLLYLTIASTDITISGTSLDGGGFATGRAFYVTNSTISITTHLNDYADFTWILFCAAGINPTIDFDWNTFDAEPDHRLNDVDYNTLADWQTGTSQDPHSEVSA